MAGRVDQGQFGEQGQCLEERAPRGLGRVEARELLAGIVGAVGSVGGGLEDVHLPNTRPRE